MRKYLLTCYIILIALGAMAQGKTTIKLIKSSNGVWTKVNGVDIEKVYNGTFQQKYSTLSADSAYVNFKENTFDAFGHVLIVQGDTLHIYADKLNYNDNTKIAVLTNNVKMVDKDATLTTNDFTYNTATRVGTYINGGKLVNKGNTLVSKNGYYYAFLRDAYFRYDVKLTTTDANIITDTLRYNSGTRISYFYGPTNIYGKKDKDTLYTENGNYNTIVEQASFGKNNLYRNGTRSLKGDSLFYDRLKGYGRAVKHVTFEDKEQKMLIKGDLGEYYKANGKAVVTQNAYAILVTEDRDTSKTDSAVLKDSVAASKPVNKPGAEKPDVKTARQTVKNTLPLKHVPPALPPTAITTDSLTRLTQNKQVQQAVKHTMPLVNGKVTPPAGVNTDTLKKKAQEQLKNLPLAIPPAPGNNIKPTVAGHKDTLVVHDTTRVKRDSMFIGADTLETQVITYKEQKDLQEKMRLAAIRDTSGKKHFVFVPYKTMPKVIVAEVPKFIPEKRNFHPDLFPKPKVAPDTAKKKVPPLTAKKKLSAQDSIKQHTDSLLALKNKIPELADTAHVRILSAHHHVRVFKSDLQAKSDSLFYSSSDSIIRSFVKPMVWAQGSQLSGDTIFLQLKNKKLDNMDVFPNAFAVNVEKQDSSHFNQLAGKRMKGFFKGNKLSRLNVDGNAENVYFIWDKGKITDVHRGESSSIRVYMDKGELTRAVFIKKAEHKYTPIESVKEDDTMLKGFIWKPEDRPRSKDDVIHLKIPAPEKISDKQPDSLSSAKTQAKPGNKPAVKIQKPLTAPGSQSAAKDSTAVKAPNQPGMPPLKKDSTIHTDSVKKAPVVKAVKDTVKQR